MWLIEPTYNGVVSKAWECSPEGTSMYVTTKKLKKCKKILKAWSKDHLRMLCKGIREQKDCYGK